MTIRHRVSQTGEVEEALRSRTHDLGERVKELECLYGMSRLVQRPDISPEEMIQGTVDLIPPGWQYPEVTCARITLDGRECRTENFGRTAWRQTSDIIVNGERNGAVEVCYLEEKPEADEGPFLKEERKLIDAIAEELGRIDKGKRVEEELDRHRDRLEELVRERTAELAQTNERLRREVEERRQAEEALRESEERFRMLAASVPVGIFETDAEGKIEYVNQRVLKITGLTALEETADWRWGIDPHPDDREAVLAERTKAMAEGRVFLGDFRILTPQGVTRWVETRICPLFNEKGEQIGHAGMVEDVTERRQAEEALRESEERFRAIVENAPFGYYRVGNDGLWQYVNPVWERMHGYSAKDVIGERFEITQTGEDVEAARQNVKRALAGETSTGEFSRITRQGTTEYHTFSIQPVRQGNEIVAIEGFINDITERKQAEEALRESERRFRQVLDVSSDMIHKLDLESDTFDYISPSVLEMTGFTREEFIAVGPRGSRRRIHPEDWLDFRRGSEEFVELGSHPHFECRWQCKDGQYRWFSESRTLVREAEGRPVAIVGAIRDVTERRRREEALRESEKRFRQVLEVSSDLICRADIATGASEYISPAVLPLTGFTQEEFTALGFRGFRQRIHPDDRQRYKQRIDSFLFRGSDVGAARRYEYRWQCKDGQYRWFSDSLALVCGEDGQPLSMVINARDTTERHQGEKALRESEERFRTLSAAAPIGIMLVDNKDGTVYCNKRFLSIFGLPKEEAMGLGWARYLHPDDREAFLAERSKAMAEGREFIREFRVVTPQGETRWLSTHTTPLLSQEGVSNSRVGTLQDITERKQAEEALRKSEDLFRTLSASAPVGIFLMMDEKGQVIYANERLQAIAGVPPGGGPMKELAAAVHPDERERVLAEWVKAAEEHVEVSQEFRILTAQGETRWVHLHARPIFAADGSRSSVVGTVEDTTERRQAEERDRQLHAEHVRANELRHMVRVLEQMSATLAHELRNPLGVISNSAYFLTNQAGIDDPRVEKHVAIIGREVASAKRVIDDILEFAHVPEILPSPASLNAIVDQALARSQVPANIRVARKLALDLPPLVCDGERLERGLINVIANAVQAMPHGGCLSVKTRLSADRVAAVFADTGEGIAPQNLAKIFDPMFTTKLRGIGLGLTVVRRTVEQHGGRVDVKSVLGHGTTVTVMLPVDCRPAQSNDELPTERRE